MRQKELILLTLTLFLTLCFQATVLSQEKNEASTGSNNEIEVKVTYCNLRLAEGWKLGNLTFNSLYSFKVSASGKPVEIKKIRDDFIGIDVVSSCVSKWEIKGVSPSSLFVASFKWKHGKGWIEQRFSGSGLTYSMTHSGIGAK